jgi:hypothetical protein
MGSPKTRNPTLGSYLSFMFISPITTWWGAVTFGLELIAFLVVKDTVVLDKITVLILLIVDSFFFFVGLLIIFRGWSIYSRAFEKISIDNIIKVDNEQFFLLDCPRSFKTGSMFEVYRKKESIEIPIGFIEITHERQDGVLQAKPIWIMPGHLLEIERMELSVDNLVVYPIMSSSTLPRWINDQAENIVNGLIKRGQQ